MPAAFVKHAIFVVLLLSTRVVDAGGLELEIESPRAVGRAGVSTVSGDSGASLIVNPAGMARRGDTRVVIAAGVHDRDAELDVTGAEGSPTLADRSGPRVAPLLAAHVSAGPLVLGLAYLEEADFARRLPEPTFGQPANDVARLFPHRYGGTRLGYRRQTLAAGAAMRATDWLGIGVTVTAARVELDERRAVWAGFAGRDPIGSAERDLDLALSGRDDFVPGVAAGILVAPYLVPIELALSASLSAPARVSGDATLSRTRNADVPRPSAADGTASLALPSPLTFRSGLRYLGERVVVEAGADLVVFAGERRPTWRVDGIEVTDQTGATGTLVDVPGLAHRRDHAVVRGAVDVQVVSGFLWLTGGYAWRSTASSPVDRAPVLADTGAHVLAIGAEGIYDDVTVSVGYARSLSPALTVDPDESDVAIVNPFEAGTATSGGRYETAADQFGISVEVAWF